MKRGAGLILASVLLLCAACHKKPRPVMPAPPDPAAEPPPIAAAPPPVPAPSAPPVLPSAPPPPLPAPFLDEAERDFESGRYGEAARAYQKHLVTASSDSGKDRALFRLAISSVLSDPGPEADGRALTHLKQLVTRYPSSSYVAEARLILGLMQEVLQLKADAKEREERAKRLAGELERLKKIDMQRPAPRAP